MSTESNTDEINLAYELNDKPPLLKTTLLGIQHVGAMIVSTMAVAIIVAGAVGLGPTETTRLIQMVVLFSGVATLVQVFPIGPVGAKLPIVMGTSFAFIGASISVGQTYGLDAVFGAVIIAALTEVLIGSQYKRLKKFFPPLVTGLIVMIIGLHLIPTGMEYIAGGDPSAGSFGSLYNLGLGGLVFLVTVGLNLFLDGILRLLSVLIGIIVGYVAAFGIHVFTGIELISFTAVNEVGWAILPQPAFFGLSFELVPILIFAALHLTAGMESIGDMSGITSAAGRNPTEDEIRGGLYVDGIMSSLGALFGAFPMTTFSQNVGIINFTGVMSRFVVAAGGVVLIGAGLIPKVGAFVLTIPEPVLGGALLVLFGTIASSGIRLIVLHEDLNRRNMVIIAVSLGLGLGVTMYPETLAQLPENVKMFAENAVIVTGFSALILNTIVPRDEMETTHIQTSEESDSPQGKPALADD